MTIVAIDGPGGAGKTTFARRLVKSLPHQTTVLHTDSFASPEEPVDWWPKLRDVIEQLRAGQTTAFRPYDWSLGHRLEPVEVKATNVVVIEGVSASRSEWRHHVDITIWIDTDPAVRRTRGIERDRVSAIEWDAEAEAEAVFFALDGGMDRADLIVAGECPNGLDPDASFALQSFSPSSTNAPFGFE